MSQEDILERLINIVLEGVDVKTTEQAKRLESYAKKHRYAVLMGFDVIHSDTVKIRQDVQWASIMIFDSMLDEALDNLLRNWHDEKKRTMYYKDYRDTIAALPLMKGIRGASLVDKKFSRSTQFEL